MLILQATKWKTVGKTQLRVTTLIQTTPSGRNQHTKNFYLIHQEALSRNGRLEAISTLINPTISGNALLLCIQPLSTGTKGSHLTEHKIGTHSHYLCYRSQSTCQASICQSATFNKALMII